MRPLLSLIITIAFLPTTVLALPVLTAPQGGTGIGSGVGLNVNDCLKVSATSPFTWTTGTCLSSGSDPFTHASYNGQTTSATSSLLLLTGSPLSLAASSTFATYASTTLFTNSGLSYLNGGLVAYASSTIGDGTQAGGLTISGGATTTGTMLITKNASSLPTALANTVLRVANSDGNQTRIVEDSFAQPSNFIFTRANTTAASPSALSSGDVIGQFSWFGYGSTAYGTLARAQVQAIAAENWTDTTQASKFYFLTSPSGNVGNAVIRLAVDSTGNIGVGSTTPYSALTVQNTYGANIPGAPLFIVASSTSSTGATGNNFFNVLSNGNVGIATATPWKMLSVAGDIIGTNITATGTLSVSGQTTLATSLSGAVSAASGVISAGTLSLANGGTNATSCGTSGAVWYYDGTRFVCAANMTYSGATTQLLTVTNASTTALSASGVLYTPVTSAILLTDANKKVGAYGGSNPCSNQVALSLSALGVISCTSITDAMFSGQLGLSHGGTNASLSGANQVAFMNSGNTALALDSSFTFTASNKLVTMTNASTTAFSATGYAQIPTQAATSTSASGQIAIISTSATSGIAYNDGTNKRLLPSETPWIIYATSTPNTGATTTLQLSAAGRDWTATQYGCVSNGGTANVQLGNGSASSTMVTSSISGTTFTALSSNNTFPAAKVWYLAIGTWATTSNSMSVSCTIMHIYTG